MKFLQLASIARYIGALFFMLMTSNAVMAQSSECRIGNVDIGSMFVSQFSNFVSPEFGGVVQKGQSRKFRIAISCLLQHYLLSVGGTGAGGRIRLVSSRGEVELTPWVVAIDDIELLQPVNLASDAVQLGKENNYITVIFSSENIPRSVGRYVGTVQVQFLAD